MSRPTSTYRRPLARRLLRVAGLLAGGLIALLLLLVAVAWLLPDAPLSPAARALLTEPPAPPEQGNGAVLLEGLRAPAGSDYAAFGRSRLAAQRARFAATDAAPDDRADLPADALPLPDTGALCDPLRQPCIERWLGDADRVSTLVATHGELLARLDAVMAQPRFETQQINHPDAPVTAFGPLAGLLRLRLADATLALENGDDARALARLTLQTRFLQRLLAAPDATLIQSMVAGSLLRSHLLVLGEWQQRWPDSLKDDAEIDALLTEVDVDTDLRGPQRREAAWTAATLHRLRSGEVAGHNATRSPLETVLLPAFYKPDATLNDWAAHVDAQTTALAAPPERRLAALQAAQATFLAGPADPYALSRLLYNPVGRMLLAVSGIDFGDYQLRLYDTRAVVRLVALQRALLLTGDSADDARVTAQLQASPLAASPDGGTRRIGYDPQTRALTWQPLGQTGPALRLEGGLYRVHLPR